MCLITVSESIFYFISFYSFSLGTDQKKETSYGEGEGEGRKSKHKKMLASKNNHAHGGKNKFMIANPQPAPIVF